MDRRNFLMGSVVASAMLAVGGYTTQAAAAVAPEDYEIAELQRRAFDWFVHVADRERGLTPHRWPSESCCSVAAVGLALTVWPVGVEQGWMERAEARTRTLFTLRFFHDAPQGPQATGVSGFRGFFYRFLETQTGYRFDQAELSTADTALLISGVLFAARFFDGDHAEDVEIRRLAETICDRVEWDWALVRTNQIAVGWHPESGFIETDEQASDDEMIALLLAMGSATHSVPSSVWSEWCSAHDQRWSSDWGPGYLNLEPTGGHPCSPIFIDFRGIRDAWMRARAGEVSDFDYFQNSVRAVASQRAYATENPGGWDGYSAEIWGLTTCDGPGEFKQVIDAQEREFLGHSVRGPGGRDDGTLAPAAAMASYPFAPKAVTDTLKAMKARYGAAIYTQWGLLHAFNPTLTEREGGLPHGRIIPGVGWVYTDHLAVDQGAVVVMIENARTELVWRFMRGEPNLTRGLRRAGFTGGWLDA